MDRRLLIVLGLGLVVAGACYLRLRANRPYDYEAHFRAAAIHQPTPLFEAVDEKNEIYRLATYLGRHRIIVVFYDGRRGADQSPELAALRDRAEELRRRDVKVVAISQAIPQENRAALDRLGEFPGPLVSDVDGSIHRQWGRLTADGKTLPGLFLVDRKGSVPYYAGAPAPFETVEDLVRALATP